MKREANNMEAGLVLGAALVYLAVIITAPGARIFPMALPPVLGVAAYFAVSRLGKTPRDLSDVLTVMTGVGLIYTLYLFLLLLSRTALPGIEDPFWRGSLYLEGDARGVMFILFLLFNHLTWSFNVKNYLWIVRAPMSFVFFLGIMLLSSFRTWLLFPPAIIVFLLLIPRQRRVRVLISFVPSLLAAFFIMPILGMTAERGQLLDSIIWVMGGAVLSIVGSVFISLIDRTSPYQKAFFFVVFFAFFILFSSVYFYALLAFSTPPGETAPDLIRIVPPTIREYFQGEGFSAPYPGLEGVRHGFLLLLGVPWVWFLRERYREYKAEKDPQHQTISAGLMTAGALVLAHVIHAPAILVGWPAFFTFGLLGAKMHPPPSPGEEGSKDMAGR